MLIDSIKELDEKSIYTAKEIPDIYIKEEFREKQLHREEAVDLMQKMIEIIYNREEPKSFDQYDPVTNAYCWLTDRHDFFFLTLWFVFKHS